MTKLRTLFTSQWLINGICITTRYKGIQCHSGVITSYMPSLWSCRHYSDVGSSPKLLTSKTKSLVDEVIKIRSEGLIPGENVTLRVSTTPDTSSTSFHSYAHFKANANGVVDLTTDQPLSGTYTSVDPMGLFWSMEVLKGQREGARLFQRDARIPIKTNLELFRGTVDFNETIESIGLKLQSSELLDSLQVSRFYLSDNVEREEVRVGRLRGTLFTPKNGGGAKMAGIIDLVGPVGGHTDFRAALLASHGFVTFALAYLMHDDLPKRMNEVEAEYFDEAVEWLNQHPRVHPDRLGMLGVSRGGGLSLLTSTRKTAVKAVVGVSTPTFHVITPITIEGNTSGYSPCEIEKCVWTASNALSIRTGFAVYPNKDALFPIDDINADLLLICGSDDQNLATDVMGYQMKERLERIGKGHRCHVVVYPGAGHNIEPPYMPLAAESYVKVTQIILHWGGEKISHAFAQKDSWERIIAFFHEKLDKAQAGH